METQIQSDTEQTKIQIPEWLARTKLEWVNQVVKLGNIFCTKGTRYIFCSYWPIEYVVVAWIMLGQLAFGPLYWSPLYFLIKLLHLYDIQPTAMIPEKAGIK